MANDFFITNRIADASVDAVLDWISKMTTKNLLLIGMAVALGTVYAIWFSDWFKPKTVEVFHTWRQARPRNASARQQPPPHPVLTFGINQKLRLDEITVVPVAALQTNEHPVPLWHLISDSNSVPVKQFIYGQFIGGMKAAVKGARPVKLETNVTYRLLISAGKFTGEHDFVLK